MKKQNCLLKFGVLTSSILFTCLCSCSYKINNKSLSFKAEYAFKSFNSNESTNYLLNFIGQRKNEDTLFGGIFFYEYEYIENGKLFNISKIYDGKSIYEFNHTEQRCYTSDTLKNFIYTFDGRIDKNCIDLTYFLNLSKFEKECKEWTMIFLKENKQIKQVTLSYDSENIKGNKEIDFDKKWEVALKHKCIYKLDDETQIENLKLSNIMPYDGVNEYIRNYKLKYLKKYQLSVIDKPKPRENEINTILETFSTFKGKLLRENELVDYNANFSNADFTIYDFWFVNCPHCPKSLKKVQEIKVKYPNVDVVAINDIDKDEKLAQIIKFRDKNNLSIPLVLVKDSTLNDLNVNNYPTVFVVDRNRKILLKIEGSSDDIEQKIYNVIKD